MANNNASVRRHVVQVSETPVGPPVQTLGMVGNDVYAVTQQDIRKVVDFRMFTLSPCQISPEAAASSTILLDLFVQEPPKKVKANNPCVRRDVLKVSEIPMAPAVHIPIVVGSERYVVIQQDIRKELDIRMFTHTCLGPVVSAAPVNVFGCPVTNLQPLSVPHVTFGIPKTPANDIALGRSNNKLCYSAGTSTEGLMKNNGCQHCPKGEELHSSCQTQTCPPCLDVDKQKNVGCQTQPATSCTGCNTSASQQLVRKVNLQVEEEEEEEDEVSDPSYQGPIPRNRNCPQENPCTSRVIDSEDRRRYESIKARICSQRLAELRRQRQQDCETIPRTRPPPPRQWLSNCQLNRERRQLG